jgi:hypothetical protein
VRERGREDREMESSEGRKGRVGGWGEGAEGEGENQIERIYPCLRHDLPSTQTDML